MGRGLTVRECPDCIANEAGINLSGHGAEGILKRGSHNGSLTHILPTTSWAKLHKI